MQIAQEEKVHVAVTKKVEPPRPRGTWGLSIHRILYLPYSLYQIHSLWVLGFCCHCYSCFMFEIVKISSLLCLSYYYTTTFLLFE